MNNNILVIGGGGYVGSMLVPKLLELGYNVKVYDLFLYGNYLNNHSNLNYYKGDIRNIKKIKTIIKDVDTIIHLACISNDPSFELNPDISKSINYDCFEPLVKLSIDLGIKKFIYASSSSVYGIKKDQNVIETANLEPLTDYSKYKALCEEILLKYKSNNFHPIVLRPSTVNGYSPRLRLDVVVNIMANLAYNTAKIRVFGGDQLRPNINMLDMIEAYITVLKAPLELTSGECFNVGDENLSVREIARKVESCFLKKITIETEHSDDNRSYHISSKKMRDVLNFKLEYNVLDGIKSITRSFDKKLFLNTLTEDNFYNLKVLRKSDLLN